MGKLAAIDIGTNSFHLIVVDVKANGSFEIVDREKEVIRLSEGSKGDIKYIMPEAIERAIVTLRRFKGIADSHSAKLRAVATSAVRESQNKIDFIKKVFYETGIEIEVISGTEEARLIYLGMLKAVPIYDNKAFCVDIGGGSTEFTIGERGKILFSISLKLGAVRLSQKFFPDYKITKEGVEKCRHWIQGEIFPVIRELKTHKIQRFVGSSGTIMSIGLMISALRNESMKESTILNNYEFSDEDLRMIEKEILKNKTSSQRLKLKGLDSKRADIIPAGVLILSEIFQHFEIKTMTISGYALREGIVIDTIQKSEDENLRTGFSNIRSESVRNLAESCKFDKEHCAHVSRLALQLFDQTQELHHLGNKEREYLDAASRLHDIGYHISHSQHHRHSMYIISNSELLGFNENEINIIANVARYHRKSHPKKSHKDFINLPAKSREIVQKLSAILRVADSFDRTHYKLVDMIKVELKERSVEITLQTTNGIPEIELWSLNRRKALFEEIFNKNIIIKNFEPSINM